MDMHDRLILIDQQVDKLIAIKNRLEIYTILGVPLGIFIGWMIWG